MRINVFCLPSPLKIHYLHHLTGSQSQVNFSHIRLNESCRKHFSNRCCLKTLKPPIKLNLRPAAAKGLTRPRIFKTEERPVSKDKNLLFNLQNHLIFSGLEEEWKGKSLKALLVGVQLLLEEQRLGVDPSCCSLEQLVALFCIQALVTVHTSHPEHQQQG